MARASKPQSHGFSFHGFDKDHYRQTEGYVRAIDQLYTAAVADFARLAGSVKVDPSKPFDFALSPAFQAKAQKIVNTLAKSMTAVIQHGTQEQWLFACRKNDEFLAHIMDTTKVGKRQLNRMQDRNLDALDQFQRRKVDGLDLSQRVWKYAGQTKELMEMGIDIAVGDGRSAADLSRDLREYLVEPHKLFRRVRDKHGNLVLSRHAAQYHPGQGVYRSSYKNALRLASTEINMAYRDSDRYRWNNLDFVVGYQVHLSNNHTLNGEPFHDICDELAGDYPKDFIFKGWHPNCRCFVTPILQDPDEFNTDELNSLKSAFFGSELKKYPSRKTVTDVPPGFHAWVKAHREAAKGWRKQPYWIRDNFAGGTLEGGLKLVKPVIPKPKPPPADKAWKDLSDEEQMKIYEMFDDVMAEYAVNDVRKAARRYHVDISYLEELIHGFPERHHDVNKIKSEFIRVSGDLDAVVAARMPDIEDLADRVILKNDAIKIWTTHGTFEAEVAKTFATIRDERWPNLDWVKDTFNMMLNDAIRYVNDGKSRFASYQNDAMSVIKKAKTVHINTSKLESLVNTTPSLSKTAPDLIREINDEIAKLEGLIGIQPQDDEVMTEIHKLNPAFREVHDLPKELTSDEIIARVGGGDKTGGSCSSLAFTYAGNRCGLDVLDFRGGSSRSTFSKSSTIMAIARRVGGVVVKSGNDLANASKLVRQTQVGKEYYFTCGQHAAIIRRVPSGIEYLELQSASTNGFKPLDEYVLKWRFGAKKSHTRYGFKFESEECLIDIDLLRSDKGFRDILGYINTSEGDQKKGCSGGMK